MFHSLTQLSLVFTFVLKTFPNYGNTNGTEIVENNICDTEECHQVAKAFAESMDQTVKPCDDFYKFACGNWELSNPSRKYLITSNSIIRFTLLAASRLREELVTASASEDTLPIQHMKRLYKSCMDNETRENEGLQKIATILRETKGWPMTMSSDGWNKDSITWQEVDRYYKSLIGLSAFFAIDIYNFPSHRGLLRFSPPVLPLRKIQYKIDRNYTSDGILVYRSVIKNVAQLFIEQNNANVSDEKLERDIDDLLRFEESLYKAHREGGEGVAATTISDLIKRLNDNIKWTTPRGKIDWSDWEMTFRNFDNMANLSILDSYLFKPIGYSRQLVKILESTDERTIVNYIQWNFLSTMLPYTTRKVNEIILENDKTVSGVQEMKPRWLECIKEIETNHAAAYLFAREYYHNNSKTAVNEMMRNLKASLKLQIGNSTWLTTTAKKAAIEKLSHISHMSGYPDWYDNETALIDYYRNLTIVDSYFENILKLKKFRWIKYVERWGQYTKQEPWTANVLVTIAQYNHLYNTITIPAATLQSPLFDGGLPSYVEYGTVGFTIAHEIGHAFDSTGISYGFNWEERIFNDNMSAIYGEHARCFIEEFNRYPDDLSGTINLINKHNKSDGERTLDENIADWIGLQTSFDAYKKMRNQKMPNGELKLPGFETFTDDQMFLISYAQMHCATKDSVIFRTNFALLDAHAPPHVRLMNTLSNTLAFAETFKCPKNSSMNPPKKCNIWMDQSIMP